MHCSRESYRSTLEQYAFSSLVDGSPLQTLFLSLADRVQDFKGAVRGPHGAREARQHWNSTVATLVSCGGEGAQTKETLESLAETLLTEGNITGAHVCYIGARRMLEHDDRASRIVLLGADHRSSKGRRTGFSSAACAFITLIFDSSFKAKTDPVVSASLLPFMFSFAVSLVDNGELDLASSYCDLTLSTMQAYESAQKGMNLGYSRAFLLQLQVSTSRQVCEIVVGRGP